MIMKYGGACTWRICPDEVTLIGRPFWWRASRNKLSGVNADEALKFLFERIGGVFILLTVMPRWVSALAYWTGLVADKAMKAAPSVDL